MRTFGLKYLKTGVSEFLFFFRRLDKPYGTIEYTVEGDWRRSILAVAAAIAGQANVRLDTDSTQADKAILQALADGVHYFSKNEIQVGNGQPCS
jgi:hypothetical protein